MVTQAPTGQAAAERLRGGDDVGADRQLLVGPERAGPPHAGLDLVEDEQGAARVARLAGGDEDLVGDGKDAGLALDRLDHHGRGPLADRGAKRVRIVAGDGDEAGRQRAEEVLAREAGRRRQRRRACGRESRRRG